MSEEKLRKYKVKLTEKKTRDRYAFLRTVSGSMRYKILVLLESEPKGMIVSDLADILGASLSRVSHQMRILREHHVVSAARANRTAKYAIADRNVRKYLMA